MRTLRKRKKMSFRDLGLKVQYISGVDNLVKDFYLPVLGRSKLYQRRTGYFNSRAWPWPLVASAV